jgi:hypothetical protein
MADPTLSGLPGVLWPSTATGSLSQAPLTSSDGSVQLAYGRAVALGTISTTNSSGVSTSQHIAVVVGSGSIGNNSGSQVPVLAVIDMSGIYTPGATVTCNPQETSGSPNCPLLIGMLQLPTTATDVILNGGLAVVATGANVLLVNLNDPTHPTFAGQVTGSFGNYIAITDQQFLLGQSMVGGAAQGVTLGVFDPEIYVSSTSPALIPIAPTPLTALSLGFLWQYQLSGGATLSQSRVPADLFVTFDTVHVKQEAGFFSSGTAAELAAITANVVAGTPLDVVWNQQAMVTNAMIDLGQVQFATVEATALGVPGKVPTFPQYLTFSCDNNDQGGGDGNRISIIRTYIANKITDRVSQKLYAPLCSDFVSSTATSPSSAHFTVQQYNTHNHPWLIVRQALLDGLEAIRTDCVSLPANQYPCSSGLQITDGYRTPADNGNTGGSAKTTSRHMFGDAADISIRPFDSVDANGNPMSVWDTGSQQYLRWYAWQQLAQAHGACVESWATMQGPLGSASPNIPHLHVDWPTLPVPGGGCPKLF